PFCPPRPATDSEQAMIWKIFIHEFYDELQIKATYDKFVASNLIQHNTNTPDGRDAAVSVIEGLLEGSQLDRVHTVVQDNFAFIHVKITPKTGPIGAFADLYRMEGTCIVEHWDVIQSLPPNATNPHPL
ncbi:hypothetical protein TRIATDRAFT_19057, partial [Trichoderma atroviride IMI 206040]